MQLRTHLMFQGQMSEALALWQRAFPEMEVEDRSPPEGDVGMAEVRLGGHILSILDSKPMHDFTFTPSMSLMVEFETAEDVDRVFAVLSEDGQVMMPLDGYDFSPRYAWIADRFGVSWQIMQRPA